MAFERISLGRGIVESARLVLFSDSQLHRANIDLIFLPCSAQFNFYEKLKPRLKFGFSPFRCIQI